MAGIDYAALEAALVRATHAALDQIQVLTRQETLYVFGLYTSGEYAYLQATANTEEGLLACAQAYMARYGDTPPSWATATRWTIDDWQRDLRWNPCDWAYHSTSTALFDEVQAVLAAGWSADWADYAADGATIVAICLRTLAGCRRRLEETGQEQTILLNLCYGDVGPATLLETALQLNPSALYQRYAADLLPVAPPARD